MRFQINHETRLDFTTPVQEHHCELRLTPREFSEQHVLAHALEVDPPAALNYYMDAFGNKVVYFNVIAPHAYLITRVSSEVETLLENPFDYRLMSPAAEMLWYEDQMRRHPDLWQYVLHRSAATPDLRLADLNGLSLPQKDSTQSIQASLMQALTWSHETLRYQPGTTKIHTPLVDTIKARTGVCQDFAHLFIALVRSWGIPARYVMGYMRAGIEGYDASGDEEATHAWAEVLMPGVGWRGFDPTNRLCANNLYISVAVGRDYLDAAPQRGTFKGSAQHDTPKIHVILQQQPQAALSEEQQKQTAQ